MNIGIIVLDTLRYDVFTNQMRRISSKSDMFFERMYSTSRWTTPAHASLFTGFYPTEVGTHTENLHLTTDKPTIAEVLSNEGFSTYLFSNNPHIDSFFAFDRGFNDVVRGPLLKGRPDESTGFDWFGLNANMSDGLVGYLNALYKIWDSDIPTVPTLREGLQLSLSSSDGGDKIDWIISALEGTGIMDESEDSFIFINSMLPHSPYKPPNEFQTVDPVSEDPLELLLSEDPVPDQIYKRQWQSYNDCAKYLDSSLVHIFKDIDWDCLFVLGDHGELFGEHNLRQHQYGMYEEVIHVPAVAYGSQVPSGNVSDIHSIVDIYETILSIIGKENIESRGEDLFSSQGREYAYAESVGSIKYSEDAKGTENRIPSYWNEPHWAYINDDLDKVIMDGEGKRVMNIVSTEIQNSLAIQQESDKFRDQLQDHAGNLTDQEIGDELQDQLEHLGYK